MSDHELIVQDGAFAPREDLDRVATRGWIAGGLGAALVVVGYLTAAPADFYSAYLAGWLFSLTIALGVFVVTMLNHISGGDWGVLLRRVSEASGRTLPFFAVAALPLVFGLEHLYSWVHPELDAAGHPVDHLLAHKQVYLNPTAFLVRGVVYFAVWTALAYLLSAWSRRHDETGDPALLVKMKRLSAAGLVIHMLVSTLASVDWIMSLDYKWFSSLFGIAFVAGQVLAAFSFAVLAMLFLSRREPLSGLVKTKLFHDYGKLMLAFVMFWAYMMISQYLIIWSGNLPEEITWYIDRSSQGWQILSLVLVLGHFALPFLLLLSADLKKKPQLLALVALWVLAMRWMDFFWQTAPSLRQAGIALHWLDPVVPLALVGLWLALLVGQLKKGNVVPTREPALKEIMSHG